MADGTVISSSQQQSDVVDGDDLHQYISKVQGIEPLSFLVAVSGRRKGGGKHVVSWSA